jgi:hypothetical protein
MEENYSRLGGDGPDNLDFRAFCPNYKEGHKKAAEQIVSRLLKDCTGEHDLPRITTIVDIGCGDGFLLSEVTKALRKAWKDAGNRKLKLVIGIDHTANPKNRSGLVYVKADLNEVEIDTCLRSAGHEIDWSQTALLCLSQTWFHFLNQQKLLATINHCRPALVVVELYHTWDLAVKTLRKRSYKGPLDEPRALDKTGGLYVLRTELQVPNSNNSHQLVSRGIAYKAVGERVAKWRFPTTQLLLHSEDLFGATKPDNFQQAETSGSLTGGCVLVQRK